VAARSSSAAAPGNGTVEPNAIHHFANLLSDSPVLPLPPNAPRVKPNRFVRWAGRCILRAGGWRMVGRFPTFPSW
jgi:hypothetical protein